MALREERWDMALTDGHQTARLWMAGKKMGDPDKAAQ